MSRVTCADYQTQLLYQPNAVLDDLADLIICRNACDHMNRPRIALEKIRWTLKDNGAFFASVDLSVARRRRCCFAENLGALLGEQSQVLTMVEESLPIVRGEFAAPERMAWVKPSVPWKKILRVYEAHLAATKQV
jgi:hypothetical protein